MTISFPLSLPSSGGGFLKYTVYAMPAAGVVSSPFTYQGQVQEYDGDGWLLQADCAYMDRETAAPWVAFLASLRGTRGTFLAGDPKVTTPLGTGAGVPQVNGGSQTGSTLATDGWTAGSSGVLLAGDYIQVGQRLYMVLQDVDADGSGEATIDIYPSLRESPGDNEYLIMENPKGLFRLSEGQYALYQVQANGAYAISFSAVEALT